MSFKFPTRDDRPFADYVHDEWQNGTPGQKVVLVSSGIVVALLAVTVLVRVVHGVYDGIGWLAAWRLTRIITDPIHHYLTVHTAGLHVAPRVLYTAWLVAAGLLLVASVAKSWGARIGWVLLGALTVATVWAGSPTTSRGLAVGLTVCAWSLLSTLAFRGAWRSKETYVFISNTIAPAKTDG